MVVKSRVVTRIKFGVIRQGGNPQSATIHSAIPSGCALTHLYQP